MSDIASFFGQQAFDTHSVEAQTDFEIVPAGKYPVFIERAEIKATKTGSGHGIALSLKILDGPHKNKSLKDWINIDHKESPQCVEIGRRCLAALGQAIGLTALGDTDQLLRQTVVAHVIVKANQNNVRTYSSAQQYAAPPIQPQMIAPVPVQAVTPTPVNTFQEPPTGGTAPPPWATRQ